MIIIINITKSLGNVQMILYVNHSFILVSESKHDYWTKYYDILGSVISELALRHIYKSGCVLCDQG